MTIDEKLKELVCQYDESTPDLRKTATCFDECSNAPRCKYLMKVIEQYAKEYAVSELEEILNKPKWEDSSILEYDYRTAIENRIKFLKGE